MELSAVLKRWACCRVRRHRSSKLTVGRREVGRGGERRREGGLACLSGPQGLELPQHRLGAGTKGQLQKHLAVPKGSGLNMLSVGPAWAWSLRELRARLLHMATAGPAVAPRMPLNKWASGRGMLIWRGSMEGGSWQDADSDESALFPALMTLTGSGWDDSSVYSFTAQLVSNKQSVTHLPTPTRADYAKNIHLQGGPTPAYRKRVTQQEPHAHHTLLEQEGKAQYTADAQRSRAKP
ncbi:hypothetical protein AOLI_G00024810 [Acnodon oligacanthus]